MNHVIVLAFAFQELSHDIGCWIETIIMLACCSETMLASHWREDHSPQVLGHYAGVWEWTPAVILLAKLQEKVQTMTDIHLKM